MCHVSSNWQWEKLVGELLWGNHKAMDIPPSGSSLNRLVPSNHSIMRPQLFWILLWKIWHTFTKERLESLRPGNLQLYVELPCLLKASSSSAALLSLGTLWFWKLELHQAGSEIFLLSFPVAPQLGNFHKLELSFSPKSWKASNIDLLIMSMLFITALLYALIFFFKKLHLMKWTVVNGSSC